MAEAAKPCLRALRLERFLPSMEVGPLDLAPLMRAWSERVLVSVDILGEDPFDHEDTPEVCGWSVGGSGKGLRGWGR